MAGSGRSVPIALGGKDRRLLYTVSNLRLATAALQRFLPAGHPKLVYKAAAALVLQDDLEAILIFLQAGFQHTDKDLELREVEKWVDKAVADKGNGEVEKIRDLIVDALKASGLVDLKYEPVTRSETGDEKTSDEKTGGGEEPAGSRPTRAE